VTQGSAESWVLTHERLPTEGQVCVILCRDPATDRLENTLGYRLSQGWVIRDERFTGWEVYAWFPVPPIPQVL
jgi:hypothetical protein